MTVLNVLFLGAAMNGAATHPDGTGFALVVVGAFGVIWGVCGLIDRLRGGGTRR